ncbi:hypothetical protein ABENE_18990 [Asticcacaulis benevestitus DSM 16100 = ATCC BAA-896]|uniref:Uncharacterized protein n=1 Tax=Asticcacaulis benevestitus DSM 16100 = ATCC BAA-896 TaxID=1121022 RepID=V4R1Q1_9CAUL|nr:hypothetical protein ABENE_18990 [Asticcacaulis benevestitus DSM 16100 = ATCC BAA-896]
MRFGIGETVFDLFADFAVVSAGAVGFENGKDGLERIAVHAGNAPNIQGTAARIPLQIIGLSQSSLLSVPRH